MKYYYDKIKQDGLARHVARMIQVKNSYRIMVGKQEGSISCGRPRRR
jgi:hypothetical protein